MPMYRNVMEILVEDKLKRVLNSLDCCTCEQCQNDIIAHALNHLPPRYSVSSKGELYTKAGAMGLQCSADIMSAISQAVVAVKEHPRHMPPNTSEQKKE